MNGKKVTSYSELRHPKHGPYKNEEIIGMNFKRVMKQKVEHHSSLSVAEIYLQEQTKLIQETGDMSLVAKSTPQLVNIQGGLYKHKNKFIPSIPKTIDKIKLEGDWLLCEDKVRKFVLYHGIQMIIFCSINGLTILSEAKRWHADGTFSCVPEGFYQLYINHGLYKSNMIPTAFILLTGKSEELYKKNDS